MEELVKTAKETVICDGITITNAHVEINHDIRFGGYFKGIVKSTANVVISDGARFTGKIYCKNLDCYGVFNGSAVVKEKATFHSSAVVEGSAKVGDFAVNSGAIISADIKVVKKPAPKVTPVVKK